MWAYHSLSTSKMLVFQHGLFLSIILYPLFFLNIKILRFQLSPIYISKPYILSLVQVQITQRI